MKLANIAMLLVGSLCFAQTTIQYDSGIAGNRIPYTIQGSSGNLFTGLGSSKTLTRVTFFISVFPSPGIFGIQIRDSGLAAANIAATAIAVPTTGLVSVNLASPVIFTGTDVWVATNAYNNKAVPLDGVSMLGQGFHAWGRQASIVGPIDTMGVINGGGNPANMWIRITGPAGLPVELLHFSAE